MQLSPSAGPYCLLILLIVPALLTEGAAAQADLPDGVGRSRPADGGSGDATRAQAVFTNSLGMKLVAYDVYLNEKAAKEIGYEYKSLDEVLAESDVISIHTPLLDSTYHIMGAENFKKMKNTAILINTARGGLVDTSALVAAIDEGEIGGAGLDVVEDEMGLSSDHPLLNRDNVVVTPHIAFYTTEAMNRIAKVTLENINAFLKGELQNVINKT